MECSNKGLFEFIKKCPTAYQTTAVLSGLFAAEGFVPLKENEKWDLRKGGKYFVTRNGSSFIAFSVPEEPAPGFHIMAAHCDSPAFKLKAGPEMKKSDLLVLNVEKYGGGILHTWFDRPLSAAGRVFVNNGGRTEQVLVNIERDLLMIPSLAIHMNRNVNDGCKYSVQKDMLPLYAKLPEEGSVSITGDILSESGIGREILSADLFLYNRQDGTIWGRNNEFISAPRLDDLQCVYALTAGFLEGAADGRKISVLAVFDNEEVGSGTKQGADSTFLSDVLQRISLGLGEDKEEYLIALSESFMLSADNAHAAHPNYPEKADPGNPVKLNGGVVIKQSANQKYSTDAESEAFVKLLCKEGEIPYQIFTNHSDIPGGSTLGNISDTHVSVKTADIGLPMLAMHSAYETAGADDTKYLAALAELFCKK